MTNKLKMSLRGKTQDKLLYIILSAPALIILGFTIFYPVVKSAYMSFFDVKLLKLSDMKWNNFKNYITVLKNNEFYNAFCLSNFYAFTVVISQLIIGLMLAFLLNSRLYGRRLFRSFLLLPWTIPTMVTALAWMWIFQHDYGVLNYIMKSAGIVEQPINWVGSVDYALLSIMIVALWRQLPFMTTMLLSGMQTIPHELKEAVQIDGGNKLHVAWHIVLPYLAGTIKSATLVAIIDNFKMFPLFWIMTQGGPMNATTTLAVLTYQTSFIKLDLGKGATIGVLWTLTLIIFSIVYNRVFKTVGSEGM